MLYTMLLWPHANARYQVETEKLARAELEVTLARLGVEYTWEEGGVAGLPSLDFAARPLADAEMAVLSRHSLLYALFERREDGALLPLFGREAPRVGAAIFPAFSNTRARRTRRLRSCSSTSPGLPGAMPEKAQPARPHVRPRHHAVRGPQPRLGRHRFGYRPRRPARSRAVFQALSGVPSLQACHAARLADAARQKERSVYGFCARRRRAASRGSGRDARARGLWRGEVRPSLRRPALRRTARLQHAAGSAFARSPCPPGRKRSSTARPLPCRSTPRRCPRARCARCLPARACACSRAALTIILNIGWSRPSRAMSP